MAFSRLTGAVPGFHPAAKAASVKLRAAGTIHMQILRDAFLPTRHRHDDFESRAGGQLRLNRLVQQRLIGIGDQLVPFIARDAYGKIVRIESRTARHGQDFSGMRVHGDDRAVLPFQRFLGGDLQIDINGEL